MNWDKFFDSPALIESARRRLSKRVMQSGECLLWKGAKNSSGYGCMPVGKNNRGATHRISWAIANKMRPATGMHIMHSCDNPSCVNPSHLSAGTPSDNQRDCINKGRKNTPKGSKHKLSKTTEGQIIRAAQLFAAGNTYRAISSQLGIGRWALIKTLQGHRWPHIQQTLKTILKQSPLREAA